MSQPVPSGAKPPSDLDIHLLATSPGWAQTPNDWFKAGQHDEDLQTPISTGGAEENGEDSSFLSDDLDDGLPMSMELRGSDMDHSDTTSMPIYWDRIFSIDERERKAGLTAIFRSLKSALLNASPIFPQSLFRLAQLVDECPFLDVQTGISDFLHSCNKEMASQGLTMPVALRASKLFKDKVVPITTDQEPQATMFKASFLNTGRVTHFHRILAWHPAFLEKFSETYDFVMRAENSQLPLQWRNYLAILAASRFKCDYLVKQQEAEFLLNGGDASWLSSPSNCPRKIQAILEVNAILAHQPWRLQPSHIADLVKTSVDAASRWSISELVHAFVIFATFRAMSGIAIGMGLNHEVDISQEQLNALSMHNQGPSSSSSSSGAHSSDLTSSGGGRTSSSSTVSRKKDLSDSDDADRPDSDDSGNGMLEQLTSKLATTRSSDKETPGDAEHRKQMFEAAGDGVASAADAAGNQAPQPSSSSLASSSGEKGRFSKYTTPYEIRHTDFDVRAKDYSVFHIQDWTWEEQAYELLERTYDCADLLDSEFTTIFELTYNQVNGQQGVDTAPFRRSIWYYVHRIHGILHDDYNYGTVNELLLRNLKKFTKDMVFTPFAVTAQDLVNLGYSLSPEEKCHIALLATEARKQAELIYALHAVSKHLLDPSAASSAPTPSLASASSSSKIHAPL